MLSASLLLRRSGRTPVLVVPGKDNVKRIVHGNGRGHCRLLVQCVVDRVL